MIEDFKILAESIQHVSLPLRSRYIFCCAPVNRNQPFVCAMFTKVTLNISLFFQQMHYIHFSSLLFQFANQVSKHEPITFDYVAKNCALPVGMPKTIADLVQLENIFDVMDIYLWLSYRFVDMFPHSKEIREAQGQLDDLIQKGIANITRLIEDAEKSLQGNEYINGIIDLPIHCNRRIDKSNVALSSIAQLLNIYSEQFATNTRRCNQINRYKHSLR